MDTRAEDTAPTLDALFSLNPMSHTQAATSAYCTRAIDIQGAFCYIGCPEGCNCDVETFFSECCCDVN